MKKCLYGRILKEIKHFKTSEQRPTKPLLGAYDSDIKEYYSHWDYLTIVPRWGKCC